MKYIVYYDMHWKRKDYRHRRRYMIQKGDYDNAPTFGLNREGCQQFELEDAIEQAFILRYSYGIVGILPVHENELLS